MQDCKRCSRAVFDQVWGEYKCAEKHRVIYPEEFLENCPFYTKGVPTVSKDNEVVLEGGDL